MQCDCQWVWVLLKIDQTFFVSWAFLPEPSRWIFCVSYQYSQPPPETLPSNGGELGGHNHLSQLIDTLHRRKTIYVFLITTKEIIHVIYFYFGKTNGYLPSQERGCWTAPTHTTSTSWLRWSWASRLSTWLSLPSPSPSFSTPLMVSIMILIWNNLYQAIRMKHLSC